MATIRKLKYKGLTHESQAKQHSACTTVHPGTTGKRIDRESTNNIPYHMYRFLMYTLNLYHPYPFILFNFKIKSGQSPIAYD